VTMAFNHILAGRRGRKGKRTRGGERGWVAIESAENRGARIVQIGVLEEGGYGNVQNRWRDSLGLKFTVGSLRS
jgi:hypothetical protein